MWPEFNFDNDRDMIQQVRLLNLRKLIAEFGSQAKLADTVGITASVISQLVTGHRDIGEKLARKIESGSGRPALWLDKSSNGVEEERAEHHAGISLRDLWESSSPEERAEFLSDLASKI